MSLFNRLQKSALWPVVEKVMGDEATWTPAAGGPALTATVLFNEPTKPQMQMGLEYQPVGWEMEYRQDQFVGLYEAVRQGSYETIAYLGRSFAVREVTLLHDGLTFRAKLEEL